MSYREEQRYKGLAISEGVAVSHICLLNEKRHSNLPEYRVEGEGAAREKERVRRAVALSGKRLDSIRRNVEERIGKAEAEIFVAQGMILNDEEMHRSINDLIDNGKLNAEVAVAQVLDDYETRLLNLDNEYIRERATDFGEIKRRLLDVLGNMQPGLQCAGDLLCRKGRDRIVVTEELLPGTTVELDPESTRGFVTERGGANSHAAILARSLGIPAVSGLAGLRAQVACGTRILVDGYTGEVVLWPTEETVRVALAAAAAREETPTPNDPVPGLKVMANVNSRHDVEEALLLKAEGIGLYRTEFDIITEGRLLSEDELGELYARTLTAMDGAPTVFRLFDLGSDKTTPFLRIPKEDNPSLGWRGARLLLARNDLLRTQARALARASCQGRVDVLYPMITGVAQFVALREAFRTAVADMQHGDIRHGVMLEVPSACLAPGKLMAEADFASIGSNDLVQYLFAVDRDNDMVADDYDPDQPVFWDLVESLVRAARTAGKPISVCGEIAGDPRFVPKLMALGIESVSVSARLIPRVRAAAASA